MAYKTFSIRIEESLYEELSGIAESEERNRNQQIVYFLKRACEARKLEEAPKEATELINQQEETG